MAYLKFNTTTKSKADNTSLIPITDGQFLIVTDTKQLMYDFGSSRIALGDIIELDTDAERAEITNPVSKFYFVKATNMLWRYSNGTWIDWNSEPCTSVSYTLLASGWSNKKQTVSITGLGANQDGYTGMALNVSDAVLEACMSARIIVTGQAAGSLTFTVTGDVPTVDIPAVLVMMN